MAPARGLFSRRSYDADASVYAAVPTSTSPRPHSDSEFSGSEADHDGLINDMEVLREEEEREKLLSGGQGLFGSIGRKVGNGSIKIGKKVRGMGRRKGVHEVVEMMGGKRLGMEEGGEFGIGDSGESEEESELEEDGLLAEKLAYERKPRKPTPRLMLLATTSLLSFLLMLIFVSLMLSTHRVYPVNPAPATLSNGTHSYRPTTLLISLDGFRADFLSRNLTPALSAFIASGLSSPYLTPSFPSVTFPNHWTLITGLYPESHGIVGNTFYDPTSGKKFYYTDPKRSLQHNWWGGEPLWATAERQGVKAAIHMWPGSEAYDGWGASYVDHFNGTESLTRKTDRILGWLDMPLIDRPQFIASYVPNIDAVGHKFGPNTTQTDDVIRQVDDMLSDLLHGIESRNLTDIVNVVIVSDHGMASTSNDRLIYLDDIIDMSQIEHTDGWPLYGLRPFPNVNLTELHEKLTSEVAANVAKGHSHWNVYLRDVDMPARWHFSNNPRIAPLWIVPDAGYAIVTRKEFDIAKIAPGEKYSPAGLHGYDNADPLMRAIFAARGPAFRRLRGGMDEHDGGMEVSGVEVEPFGNWEVYRIVCEALGIEEGLGGNNATMERVGGFKLLAGGHEVATVTSAVAASSVVVGVVGTSTLTSIPTSTPTSTPTSALTSIPTSTATSTPTSTPSSSSTDSTADEDSEANKEAMDWLEYVKMKAEKLKDALDKWWEGVWVDGGD